LLLLAEHARNVALGDVRDLVREHRGELRLGVGGADQPGVHPYEAARKREGVDGGIAQDEELEVVARPARHAREPRAQLAEVLADLGIVDVARLAEADLAHDALAEAPLHLRRQRGFAAAPEVGQRLSERARREGDHRDGEQGG
jgi:hypothetical protein